MRGILLFLKNIPHNLTTPKIILNSLPVSVLQVKKSKQKVDNFDEAPHPLPNPQGLHGTK